MSADRAEAPATAPAEAAPPPLQALLHGDSLAHLDSLDGLLATPAFSEPAPPTGPERHERTYRRLRAVGQWAGGAAALHRDPGRLLAALEWAAAVDPPLVLAGTVQYAVCVAAMLELGRPGPYLAPLIDDVDQHRTFGSIMITEVGHGNSHLATRTEARFDPATREFVLRTPGPGAAKFMSHVAGGTRAHMAVVYAALHVDGHPRGVFPFAVRIRDGARPTAGVSIAELPETTAVPLNYALVSFDGARVPYDGWLRDTASVRDDGCFHDPLDPARRLTRSLAVSSNASTGAAAALTAAARAAVTIGLRHSATRLTEGRLRPGIPVLDHRTQQEALYPLLADVYACSLLVVRLKARYLRQRLSAGNIRPAGPAVFAPWATVSREQALAKVAATRLLERTAAVCRERSGAQGLLSVNRLLEYEGLAQVYQAAAGDNLLIRLDAGKQLVEDSGHTVTVPARLPAPPSADAAPALAAQREHTLLTALRRRVCGLPEAERQTFETWNPLLPGLVELADAHQDRLLLAAFADAARDAAARHAPYADALGSLRSLHALGWFERTLGWHLEHATLTAGEAQRVHRTHERALTEVHAQVPVLLEGFALPSARLSAPMAEQDYVTALFGRCATTP